MPRTQKFQEGNFELICMESNMNVGYNIFILGLSKTWFYLFIYLFIVMGQSKMPIPKSLKLLYSTMNLNTISLALVGKANKCEIFIINSIFYVTKKNF